MRYATDAYAPTLYAGAFGPSAGRCLVSEPLDRGANSWQPVPQGSFATMTRDGLSIRPFAPVSPELAMSA